MVDRLAVDVPGPAGGWGRPWPNVAEIEAVLPHEKWTLVGGPMTQLHGIHRGIDTLRPTTDIDMVLHIETTHGVAAETPGRRPSNPADASHSHAEGHPFGRHPLLGRA